MTLGLQLALTRPWWMWKHKVIQDALGAAKLRYCLPLIDEALEKNRAAGRLPATIKDLADPRYLDRDPRNVERIEDGTYTLTDQHVLGISVSVGIPLEKLLPATSVWIELAAVNLCSSAFDRKAARAYAHYVTASTPGSQNTSLDVTLVKRIQRMLRDEFSTDTEVEGAVMSVAECVGRVLERLQERTK